MLINKSIVNTTTKIINNKNFIINYSKTLGRPLFASYDILPNQISQFKYGRKKCKRDLRLDDKQIYQLDPKSNIFTNSISRGHLCPSFMMSYDKTINGLWSSTYLMTNIIPQNIEFNCGTWRELEINTLSFIKKVAKNVKIIVGATELDYKSNTGFNFINFNKPIIWFDKKKNFIYKIPNIMYMIVITEYEVKCYIGLNNSSQQIYSIDLENLLCLI